MRLSIKEQLQAATALYLIPLNDPRDGMSTARYAVYTLINGTLDVLWPNDTHLSDKPSKQATDAGMKHSTNRKYPAYHFALGGCGYSKTYEILTDLRRHCGRKDLPAFTLEGCSPSLIG